MFLPAPPAVSASGSAEEQRVAREKRKNIQQLKSLSTEQVSLNSTFTLILQLIVLPPSLRYFILQLIVLPPPH